MDSLRIEKIATAEVENIFLKQSNQIDPNVESGDRGISFDGSAIVFSENNFTKDSYLSSIPVQVKGMQVDKFSKKFAKYYDFDKSTFENFQLEDGVVVFLVEILKSNPRETRTYYKFLDAMLLEGMLNTLTDNNRNTRVIELEKITPQLDIDSIFMEIAIHRKSYGYATAKYDSFLQGNITAVTKGNIFENKVVENVSKTISDYEYKSSNSEFNKNLKKEMVEILNGDIITDTLLLAKINADFEKLHLFDKLPKDNRDLALLIKAKYEATITQYDLSRATLNSIDINNFNYINEYHKVNVEANIDIDNSSNFKKLLNQTNLLQEEKSKYLASYYLKHGLYLECYNLIKLNSLEDIEWSYLYGVYLTQTGQYLDSWKEFKRVYSKKALIEVKYNEIQAFLLNANVIAFSSSIENIDSKMLVLILDEIEALRNKVFAMENVEMPGLEKLYLEAKMFLDPMDTLDTINQLLLDDESKPNNKQYLIELKVTNLMLLNKFDITLDYIEDLEKRYITNRIVAFKINILEKSKKYEELYSYSVYLLENTDASTNTGIFELGLESFLRMYLILSITDVDYFERTVNTAIEKYDPDFFTLLCLEDARKALNSNQYGESNNLIIEKFESYPDIRKTQALRQYLLSNHALELAEMIYPLLKTNDEYTAREILSILYLNNNQVEKALENLAEFKSNELSDTMIIVKAEAFNRMNQFRATVRLYKETENKNVDFLNKVLIAKINLFDNNDVEFICYSLLETEDENFHVNAAIALVSFGIDLIRGMQIIEKKILLNKFLNNEINRMFISLCFSNIKKVENNNGINLCNNKELKWYKISDNVTSKEIVVVPDDWNISSFSQFLFKGINSDFQFAIQGVSIAETFIFDNVEYTLVEEKKLLTFILHEVLKLESGDIDSDKPFKSISIKGDNLDTLIDFLEQTDQSKYYEEIQRIYHQYHAPLVYGKVISENNLLEFYCALFEDKFTRYYVGKEQKFSPDSQYQISISSIAFLFSLQLLDVLSEYSNLFIEKSQRTLLENIFTEELDSTTVGRMRLINGELIFDKKDDNKKSELKRMYREVVRCTRGLNVNEVGLIDKRVHSLVNFDASTMQAAIESDLILLCEDEAAQKIIQNDFNIQTSSIGSIISHYYIYKIEDINSYLNILNQVIEKESAWILHDENIQKMYLLVSSSNNPKLEEKFFKWFHLYVEYFNISLSL